MSTLAGPQRLNFETLDCKDKAKNFETAFALAESYGVMRMLDVSDMVKLARPDKRSVMLYLSEIYKTFK